MQRTTDVLISIRRMIKLYEKMLKRACEKYQLTQIEADIISFLQNNPGKDTAKDIAELRMLSKGNVSQAVENLIQRSLLKRQQDTADRRRIHLSLLPKAKPMMGEIEKMRQEFQKEVFAGFSQEEREQYAAFNDRIMQNTNSAMERRKKA